MEQTINTNYFGPRRVNDAFLPLLQRPGGRIVNVASASGPNFVSSLPQGSPLRDLARPWKLSGGLASLDATARTMEGDNAYGASKALLNAYTWMFAKLHPDVVINSVTPGYILTDLTAGTSASNPPSKGAVPPCFLMMDEDVAKQPTGRYYGSDCVRSPMDVYRGPGDAPYVNDEDLADMPVA